MTTRSGARIYRRQPRPLAPGACPQCGRVVAISPSGRRRSHLAADRRPCPGGRVFVGDPTPVELDELPDVVMPGPRNPWSGRAGPEPPAPPDPRACVCGWRPKLKSDGTFAAHRTRPDDPSAPYCDNGAPRSY